MAVPDYQSLMLPVLMSAANGEVRISEVVRQLADELSRKKGVMTLLYAQEGERK